MARNFFTAQNFFTNLPSEILTDILSRLPIPTIKTCKCVCKSWLHFINSDYFIIFHLSRSTPALAVVGYRVFEIDEPPNVRPVADFDHTAFITRPNSSIAIQGSADGLILLSDHDNNISQYLYLLNPITRDYIELRSPEERVRRTYGFGVGKFSGQYKVVSITLPKSKCEVYTVGTGSWRSVESGHELVYTCPTCPTHGMFLDGNLHWLVSDIDRRRRISCFDLETEEFSSFVPAPVSGNLFVLRDCLCLMDYSSESFDDDEMEFWLMKEYGEEKSWVKEFVVRLPYRMVQPSDIIYPVKFFENGDVLIADHFLFYYSVRTKTNHRVNIPQLDRQTSVHAIACVPSFLSLMRFKMENVRSF